MNTPTPATPPAAANDQKPGVSAADAPKAAAAPVEPAAEQTFNIEFNGQKVALTAKQIMALQEKAKQFDLTAKQKAELEKGLANVLSRLDEDPLGLYAARGKDAKALVVERFKKMIEEDQQDPTQRELAQLRAEREARLKQDEATKKAKEEAELQTKRKELYITVLKEIDKVLTEKGLPKDQYTIDRLLRIMSSGKRVRGQTFSVADAAEIVEREEIRHLGFIAKQLPSEKLKAIFGPDIIKKLNSEQIDALKKADILVNKENKAAAAEAKKVTNDEKKKYRREFNGI